MFASIKRLTDKIPDSAPKPMVLGLFLWLAAAILMALAILFAQLNWMGLYQIVFAIIFVLILSFICCVAWFLVEFMTGRKTTWRQRENT
ncbi:MAG: hypothetical protein WC208_01565 [Gallionella sp.]|jgi:TRAP-type C4-dicarboxylate transport system permease large subunit